jgi:hypothetical protein
MTRLVVLFAVVAALAVPAAAWAIVHGSTPIRCVGAVDASGGSAGGFAAAPVLTDPDNPAPNPPMPSRAGTDC